MKTTPYTDLHIKLGAKMAEFAGYNMPIQYTTLIEEHNNVRNNVGVFDVSHMGEFRAKGPIAKHFMQYVTTNNVEDLFDGKVQYTCLPNGQGGVVDDMLVYRVHDDEYFMVPNAANIDKDWNWMSQIADKMGMELGKDFVNESEQWAQLAVQGPNVLKAMQKLTSENIVDMEYYTFKILTFAGIPNIILEHRRHGVLHLQDPHLRRHPQHHPLHHRLHRRRRMRNLHPQGESPRGVGQGLRGW